MLKATNTQPQLNVYFLPISARNRHFYIRIFLCFLPITFLLKRMTAEYFLFLRVLRATISSIELPEPLASTGKRRD